MQTPQITTALGIVCLTLGVAAQHTLGAPVALTKIALTGDSAPASVTGATYNFFSQFFGPQIDATGGVVFLANLQGSDVNSGTETVIVADRGDIQKIIAREGDPIFGTDTTISIFDALRLNNTGEFAFAVVLRGETVASNNDKAIVASAGDAMRLVAREGDPIPNDPLDTTFSELSGHVFNAAGQTAFLAKIRGQDVSSNTDTVLFSEGSGSLQPVAREGAQSPGANPGVDYRDFFTPFPRTPAINSDGDTAFFAQLSNPGSIASGNFLYNTTTTQLVVAGGSAAPMIDSQARFAAVAEPRLNDADQTVFRGFLQHTPGVTSRNDSGIFVIGPETSSVVAREGSRPPGTPLGVEFEVFGNIATPVIGSTGQVVFTANVRGSSVGGINERGIWMTDPAGQLIMVARGGNPAPGPGPASKFTSMGLPSINGSGQVAFLGGYCETNANGFCGVNGGAGIWATNRAGELLSVVRVGDQIDVNNDPAVTDLREVRFLWLDGVSGGEDGFGSPLNDAGQLAFLLEFTDGSRGVFVAATVPEPTALILIFACVVVRATNRNHPSSARG